MMGSHAGQFIQRGVPEEKEEAEEDRGKEARD